MADIKIGISTEGASKTRTELNSIATAGEKVVATNEKIDTSNQKLNSSYKGLGGGIRNASYQFQDLAVQIQGGISPIKAVSQQLPQLLQSFGMYGVAAGAVVAILGAVISSMDDFVSESEKLTRASKNVADGFDLLRASSRGLGDDSIKALNAWTKAWNVASESVRKDLERNMKAQQAALQIEVMMLGNRLALNRAIQEGRLYENAVTGVISQGQAKQPDITKAGTEINRFYAAQQELIAVSKMVGGGEKGLLKTESEIESQKELVRTYDVRISKLQEEAKWMGLSSAEKDKAIALFELESQKVKLGSVAYERLKKSMSEAIDANNIAKNEQKLKEYNLEQAKTISLMELETQSVSMSTIEHERLVDARKTGFDIQKATIGMTKEQAQAYADAAWAAFLFRDGLRDIKQAQKESFGDGANEALKKYKEDLSDVARSAETLFTNAFKGMEDAMVSAFSTGKLSFKSMIDMMMQDITRLVVRQAIMRPLFGDMGGMGGGGAIASASPGLLSSIGDTAMKTFSLLSGGGIAMATGTNYVPYDGFQATLHKGEAVVPAKYNPAAGGEGAGNITYSPVINIDSRADQTQVRQLVLSAVQQGQVDLVDRINRGQVRVRAS